MEYGMKISLLFLSLLILKGCTPSDSVFVREHPDNQPPAITRTWAIDFDISGGFAGIRQKLSITSSGTMVAIDNKQGRRVERLLQPAQLTELDKLLTRIESTPITEDQTRISSQCADCVKYLIKANINNKRYSLRSHTGEQMSPAFVDLTSHLVSILRHALSMSSNKQ